MHEKRGRRTSIRVALVVSATLFLGCRLVTEGLLADGVTPTSAPSASPASVAVAGTPSPQPATVTNTPLPSVTPTPQPTPTPSPTLAAAATATRSAGETTFDSWLVYRAAGGLMVLPPGSGEPIQLAPAPIYQWEASTAGGRLLVAFVTGAPGDTLSELRLEVHAPAGDAALLSLPLTSPETAIAPDAAPGETNVEIARALTQVDSLAWSPTGDRLAFMGAHQGASSDLYLYDVAADAITQLSSGPSQAIKPAWSPDGAYIVHLGVSTLGSGAGYGVEGMWAAASGGEEIVTLDLPHDSRDEVWLGWHGDHTLLAHSFNPACGDNNLRAVDVAAGESRTLWGGDFDAATFDPTTGHVLFSLGGRSETCVFVTRPGLLLTHPRAQDNPVVHDTPVESARDLDWSDPLDSFVAAAENVLTITTTGDVHLLPSPIVTIPTISPDGGWAAWAGEGGLWAGPLGEEASQVYGDAAFLPRWTPGGSLLFFGADGLYHAPLPDFAPTLIVPGVQARDAVLLEVP